MIISDRAQTVVSVFDDQNLSEKIRFCMLTRGCLRAHAMALIAYVEPWLLCAHAKDCAFSRNRYYRPTRMCLRDHAVGFSCALEVLACSRKCLCLLTRSKQIIHVTSMISSLEFP